MAEIILNYSKTQYEAKIIELEECYTQLSTHLDRMCELRDQMSQFWSDKHAQNLGQVLLLQIQHVQDAMDRTSDTIALYKSSIEKLGGADQFIEDTLKDILAILSGLES